MGRISGICILLAMWLVAGCDSENEPPPPNPMQLFFVRVGTFDLDLSDPAQNESAPTDKPIVARV